MKASFYTIHYTLISLLLVSIFACKSTDKQEQNNQHTSELTEQLRRQHQEWLQEHLSWVEEQRKYEEILQQIKQMYTDLNKSSAPLDSILKAQQKIVEQHAQMLSNHTVNIDAQGEIVNRHEQKEIDDEYAKKKRQKIEQDHEKLEQQHESLLEQYKTNLQEMLLLLQEMGVPNTEIQSIRERI